MFRVKNKYREEKSIRVTKFFAILMSVMMIFVLFNGCGGKPKSKSPKTQSKSQTVKSKVNQASSVSSQISDEIVVAPGTLKLTDTSKLPQAEFGRENPFLPLVAKRQGRQEPREEVRPFGFSEDQLARIRTPLPNISPSNTSVSQRAAELKSKSVVKPPVNLKLTLIMDDNTALFEENKVSKYVSVGDTIAGMKVLEIRSNEVILADGEGTHSVKLGATFTAQQKT